MSDRSIRGLIDRFEVATNTYWNSWAVCGFLVVGVVASTGNGQSPWTIPPRTFPLPCSVRVRVKSGVSRVRVIARIRLRFMVWFRGNVREGKCSVICVYFCDDVSGFFNPFVNKIDWLIDTRFNFPSDFNALTLLDWRRDGHLVGPQKVIFE